MTQDASDFVKNPYDKPFSQQPVFDKLRAEEWGLPEYVEGMQLRPFQKIGINFGIKRRRFILGVPPGGGKTIMALAILESPALKKLVDRVIILCNKNAVNTWIRHIKTYYPEHADAIVHLTGRSDIRQGLWRSPGKYFIISPASMITDFGKRRVKRTVLRPDYEDMDYEITSSKKIIPDWIFSPQTAWITDESHKFLRNRGSAIFETLQDASMAANAMIHVTGSPASRGPQDMWPLLHLCDQRMFSSYWRYINAYCLVEDNGMGKAIIGVKNQQGWRNVVGPYLFYRSKEQIADQMPDKVRTIVPVEMDDIQAKVYKELSEELLHCLPNNRFIMTDNSLTLSMTLRKLLVTPKLIHPSYPIGNALPYAFERADEMEESHFVVFTKFRKAIPHFIDYANSAECEYKYTPFALYGGTSPKQLADTIKAWESSPKGVMFCSIDYAQSFELIKACYACIIGPDFDPENNKQAEDRLNRLSATRTTYIEYVCHKRTYEEDILAIVAQYARDVRSLFTNSAEVEKLFKGLLSAKDWQPLPQPIDHYGQLDHNPGYANPQIVNIDDEDIPF